MVIMKRQALDIYDDFPSDMKVYLKNYGWHFNKSACDFAVSLMKKKVDGKLKTIEPITKEQLDTMMKNHGVELEDKNGYDYVFVANMCKADYLGSSVPDELYLCLYVKDTIDDEDAGDGVTMRRWYATMVANGEVVFWEDFL